MKFSTSLLLPALALLAMASASADADIIVKIFRTDDTTNDDAPGDANDDGPGGLTTANVGPQAHLKAVHDCTRSGSYVNQWFYDSWEKGPFECFYADNDTPWTMRNAYRAGGEEGVHWVYTDSGDDSMCLTNWEYYTADGKSLKSTVEKTTTLGGSRPWCALPVYRSGGVEGKQWANCKCLARHLTETATEANATTV